MATSKWSPPSGESASPSPPPQIRVVLRQSGRLVDARERHARVRRAPSQTGSTVCSAMRAAAAAAQAAVRPALAAAAAAAVAAAASGGASGDGGGGGGGGLVAGRDTRQGLRRSARLARRAATRRQLAAHAPSPCTRAGRRRRRRQQAHCTAHRPQTTPTPPALPGRRPARCRQPRRAAAAKSVERRGDCAARGAIALARHPRRARESAARRPAPPRARRRASRRARRMRRARSRPRCRATRTRRARRRLLGQRFLHQSVSGAGDSRPRAAQHLVECAARCEVSTWKWRRCATASALAPAAAKEKENGLHAISRCEHTNLALFLV